METLSLVPEQKQLERDFDDLARIVGNYGCYENEDHKDFSNMFEKGLQKLISTVTFSRALQELEDTDTNRAIALKDLFSSAKNIAEDELNVRKKRSLFGNNGSLLNNVISWKDRIIVIKKGTRYPNRSK